MLCHEHEAPAHQAGRGPSFARDIGALFRRHGQEYRRTHALGDMQRRALRDISVCRTGALGGHRDVCRNCGHERAVYNSCRNRNCSKCGALRQAQWVEARLERTLPTGHFHVVFTLPSELRPLVREHRALLLDLLFAAASQTILQLARDPKRLGATVGITAVVHTWARNLSFHPHLHCIVTAGGLASDGRWVPTREKYLLPVKVLGKMFRGKFLAGLARLFDEGKLDARPYTTGVVANLVEPRNFARLKNVLYRKDWLVYAKSPFRNPRALFRYLGLYTHRVAISNQRLLSIDDQQVVFRTKGKKTCRLTPLEFIHRFVQHVLPRGFVKIRHFGLLAAGNVNTRLAVARASLEGAHAQLGRPPEAGSKSRPVDWRTLLYKLTGIDIAVCPICRGPLTEEGLLATPALARAPPSASP